MREIKFRAWDEEIGKIRGVGAFKIYSDEDNGIHSGYSHPKTGDWVELKLMQYTGLKDKNGLDEIYEGDIVGVDGLKKGNVYENRSLLQEESNLIIQGLGTSSWEATNKKAMERGCQYSE